MGFAESRFPSSSYYAFLQNLHNRLQPEVYLETGVETGKSLQLAKGLAIAIDPQPRLTIALGENMRIFEQTSDDFFATHEVFGLTGRKPVDLAFIDGLHLFEAALRDFINIEKYGHAGTVVCIHAVLPETEKMALRNPQLDGWTGDVFGLIRVLREHRPDLFAITLDIPNNEILVVSNLNPTNRVLQDHFPQIVAQHLAMDYPRIHEQRKAIFDVVPYSEAIVEYLVGNMEISRARRRMQGARAILKSDPRVRLGTAA